MEELFDFLTPEAAAGQDDFVVTWTASSSVASSKQAEALALLLTWIFCLAFPPLFLVTQNAFVR